MTLDVSSGKVKDPSSVVETPRPSSDGGGKLSTERPAMMQLSVKPSPEGYASASFLESSDAGSLSDLRGSVRRRSPVPVESKSRLKRLKKRRIRPFSILDDFKRREKPDADGGEEGAGGGIMFINQYYGYESSSTATSTFQMRLDKR